MKVPLALISAAYGKSTFIVGGGQVYPHSEPHILSLHRHSEIPAETHFCGGSIISEMIGISAAHCKMRVGTVDAVAGAHNIVTPEPEQQTVAVKDFISHPAYSSITLANDISVLKFETPLIFNENIKPIPMPEARGDEWMTPGSKVRVCGWGNTSPIGSLYPSKLHCVDTFYISKEACNQKLHYDGQVLWGMFCAGELNSGGKDACQGDSGGPMTQDEKLVGVVSWGMACGSPIYPGVYTDVALYRNWVEEHLN